MQFYVNKHPGKISPIPDSQGFRRMRESHNIVIQILLLIVFAFLCLAIVVLSQKLLGIHVRTKFYQGDFIFSYFVQSLVLLVSSRFLIHICFFPRGPFSKKVAYGFQLFPPKVYGFYNGGIKKGRKVLRLLAPFILISVACLIVMKFQFFGRKGGAYYIPLYTLYLNAAYSCSDLYTALVSLRSPKGSLFHDRNKVTYIK